MSRNKDRRGDRRSRTGQVPTLRPSGHAPRVGFGVPDMSYEDTPTVFRTGLRLDIDSEPAKEYSLGRRNAVSLAELRIHLQRWAPLAHEASALAETLTVEEFAMIKGLRNADAAAAVSRKELPERLLTVFFPEPLATINVLAGRFHSPFVTVLWRMREDRMLTIDVDGRISLAPAVGSIAAEARTEFVSGVWLKAAGFLEEGVSQGNSEGDGGTAK